MPTFQILPYTDDSSMSRCTAQSLVEMKKFDPKDMAKRFTLEYNKEPNRGYGGHVVNVFAGLMLANYEHPYEPANRQFGGLGSYGTLHILVKTLNSIQTFFSKQEMAERCAPAPSPSTATT